MSAENENFTWRVERLAAQYRDYLATLPPKAGSEDPSPSILYVLRVIDDFLFAAEKDRLLSYKQGKCDALLAANTANEEIRRGLLVEMRYLRMGGAV